MNDNKEVFIQDDNLGLVKQCVESLKRRKIQLLTNTYITMSIDDIKRNAEIESAEETERIIVSMVSKLY